MSGVVLYWAGSLVGAVLFFFSGYWLSRARKEAAPAAPTDSGKVATLEGLVKRHESTIAELRAAEAGTRGMLEAAARSAREGDARAAEAEAQRKALEGEKRSMEGAIGRVEAEKRALEAKLSEIEGEKRALEASVRGADGDRPRADEERRRLEDEKRRVEAEKRAIAEQLAHRTQESQKLGAEVAAAAERAKQTAADAQRARREADEARAQIDALRRRGEQASLSAETAQRELADARRALAAAQAERDARAREAEAEREARARELAAVRATRTEEIEALRAAGSAEAEAVRDRLARDLAREAEETRALKVELARAREDVARLRDDLDAARAAAENAGRGLTERDEALARLKPLEGERGDLVVRLAALEHASAEAEQLRSERAALTARIEDLERAVAARPEQKVVDDLRRELGFQREVASSRNEALEQSRQEAAALGVAAGEVASLQRKIADLTAEVSELRAAGYLTRSVVTKAYPLPPVDAASSSPQVFLDRLATQMPRIRSAVIADAVGLVVASHGELGEQLGAYGTFLWGAAARAMEILPVGEVSEVRLRGANDVSIAARQFIAASSSRFVLTTIEVAPDRKEDRDADQRLAFAASALAI